MNCIKRSTICFIIALLMAGCIPEQKVIWSPDGKQGAVLGFEDDMQTLYLSDSNGTLSARLFDNVYRVAWRPDSQGLILVRNRMVDSWSELESQIVSEERVEIVQIANTALSVYQQTGDAEYLSLQGYDDNYKNAACLYLKHRKTKLFEALNLEEEKPLTVGVFSLQKASVRGRHIEIEETVAASTLPIWDIRVSPRDNAAVFTCGDDDTASPSASLYIASLEGNSSVRQICRNVSWYPDWTPDGQSVVYAACAYGSQNNDLQLGAIIRSRVIDESGHIISEFAEREELAGVVMNQFNRVRCAPDGEIIFTAFEIHLPASSFDMPENMNLFSIHPSRQAIVTRVVPRNIESYFGEVSWWFEFSPDYKHIAVVDSEDQVGVLTLASGEARSMGDKKTTGLPSWRTASELTCTHSDGEEDSDPEIVMYSLQEDVEPITLSSNWPPALVKSMID